MGGWLVVDKPGGVTSRDVVNAVQTWFPRRTKVGHTGTLDPLATGVLVVAVGAATRLSHLVQAMGKTYRSRFRFGATSDTDDADGTVVVRSPAGTVPSHGDMLAALSQFVGEVQQLPPAYSALKVDGQRAHQLARRGDDVRLAARPVRIDAVRLLGYEWPFADVEIDCGKGTYIRSIARDVGAALGVGGLVQTLRRTRIGEFRVDRAMTLDGGNRSGRPELQPLVAATTSLVRITLSADDCRRFRHGQIVTSAGVTAGVVGQEVAVVSGAGELVGIGQVPALGVVRPAVVIPADPLPDGS